MGEVKRLSSNLIGTEPNSRLSTSRESDETAPQGAPQKVGTYQGGQKVSILDYCGILFSFDTNGKVEDITVRHPKLCR